MEETSSSFQILLAGVAPIPQTLQHGASWHLWDPHHSLVFPGSSLCPQCPFLLCSPISRGAMCCGKDHILLRDALCPGRAQLELALLCAGLSCPGFQVLLQQQETSRGVLSGAGRCCSTAASWSYGEGGTLPRTFWANLGQDSFLPACFLLFFFTQTQRCLC